MLTSRRGAAEIASIIRREIEQGRLAAQERLPAERTMAETYAVARGTIREAIGRLAEEGLVEVRRGSGAYVRAENAQQLNPVIQQARPLELIDARFALEPHICRLAVLHARDGDLERTEALLARMEAAAHDPSEFAAADTVFHTVLAELTGNNLLVWIINQINSVRSQEQWSRMLLMTNTPDMIRTYNQQHRQIVDAIRSRDSEAAATAMKSHLESARLALMRAASA
ncbi:MAG: FadR/GntR family transcriptional regulator [Alphaproteobacteria bacterium]